MLLEEPRDDVWAEGERHAAVVLAPARDVLVRVGPQEVAEEACSTIGSRGRVRKATEQDEEEGGAGGERESVDAPVSGTSVGRMTLLICSMLCRSGLRPPCIVKIFSSMMAAMGRQLKQSVNVFHSLMLYRRLPASVPEESVSGRGQDALCGACRART